MDNRFPIRQDPIRLVVRAMGAALALVLGVGIPAGYGVLNYLRFEAEITHYAEMGADAVEEYIYKNPDMWFYRTELLAELLDRIAVGHHPVDTALIVDGREIARSGSDARRAAIASGHAHDPQLPWPRLQFHVPVLLHTRQIAQVSVTASFLPQFTEFGFIWLSMLMVSAISYRGLVVAPLRLLERTIDDLREAAERAKAADIAKSEFLATMSHEIRTPLNGVLGMAELLGTTRLDERQRMFADIIRKSGQSLLSVINDILDFSKIDAGFLEIDPQPFKLGAIANEPARLVARAAEDKGLELTVRIQPDLPSRVRGDLGRIRQVVTNLVSNAVKFTDRGQVVIDVSGVEAPDDNGGRQINLRVEVRDTGVGIPLMLSEKIFEKFSQVDSSATRHHEGTGLGLAIVTGLIRLMGGQIGVESVPGKGSTFWFTLRLPIDETVQKNPPAPVQLEGKRVLVIDDNEINRCILQELLGAWQFSDASAASGSEGMQRLVNAASQGRPFDLLILDHHMPGMNGDDVVRAVRSTPEIADTPIILLTSIDAFASSAAGDVSVVQAYLVKPAEASQLFNAIATTLTGTAEMPIAEPVMPVPFTASAMQPDDRRVDVLLVEDNYVNRVVVEQILQMMGLSNVAVENGEAAIDRFKAIRPGLVLMDVSMPIMNGYDATRQIREIEQAQGLDRTPIIGLTANAMQGDREKCLEAGMDDYLAKPISTAGLTAMIESRIGFKSEAETSAAASTVPEQGASDLAAE